MQHTLRTRWIFWNTPHRAALRDLPDDLYVYWKAVASREFPGIPKDAVFFARAAEGLMRFFACMGEGGASCALPSKAADSVWHAWLALDRDGLKRFCIKHFGMPIPHVEGANMELGPAVGTTWLRARRREMGQPLIPRLFALDRKLRMPHGFGYEARHGWVAYSMLDQHGRPQGNYTVPDGLTESALIAAGVFTAIEIARMKRKAAEDSSGDGGGCGSIDSGGDCGDSGGSSCGSSCGSGCGGGGD